jgi:HlyD family secretion protein
VFVVDNGIVRLRPVELGQRNDVEGQVLDGLTAGEHVVMHPPDTLIDGAQVAMRGDE